MENISCTAKLFRNLIPSIILMVVLVSLTSSATAQEEILPNNALISVSQHDIDTWQAKVGFYREIEAYQLLLAEHTANTWGAKTEFFRDLQLDQHAATTWEAKANFWRN